MITRILAALLAATISFSQATFADESASAEMFTAEEKKTIAAIASVVDIDADLAALAFWAQREVEHITGSSDEDLETQIQILELKLVALELGEIWWKFEGVALTMKMEREADHLKTASLEVVSWANTLGKDGVEKVTELMQFALPIATRRTGIQIQCGISRVSDIADCVSVIGQSDPNFADLLGPVVQMMAEFELYTSATEIVYE